MTEFKTLWEKNSLSTNQICVLTYYFFIFVQVVSSRKPVIRGDASSRSTGDRETVIKHTSHIAKRKDQGYLLRKTDLRIHYSDDDSISLPSDSQETVTETKLVVTQQDSIMQMLALLLEDRQKDREERTKRKEERQKDREERQTARLDRWLNRIQLMKEGDDVEDYI